MLGFRVNSTFQGKALRHAALACGMAIGALMAAPAHAVPSPQTTAQPSAHIPYIVRSDYGGSVQKRLRDIRALQVSKRQVQIRGAFCMSSCTMLLGLENTCVMPHTVFGFHGPSKRGAALPEPVFNKVSRIIARHYPRQLRSWYMKVARHDITGVHKLTGAELIALKAAKPCDADRYAMRSGAAERPFSRHQRSN